VNRASPQFLLPTVSLTGVVSPLANSGCSAAVGAAAGLYLRQAVHGLLNPGDFRQLRIDGLQLLGVPRLEHPQLFGMLSLGRAAALDQVVLGAANVVGGEGPHLA